MRRSVLAVCAAALGTVLSISYAAAAIASEPAAGAAPAWARPVIVVWPGHSFQAAVNRARPGDTVLVKPGVYDQDVLIRTDRITLLGSGDSRHGTVIRPPHRPSHTICNQVFGPTGVCVFGKRVNPKTGQVLERVLRDTVSGLLVTGFHGSGVFGYGTNGLTVTHVAAIDDGGYGISRFVSSGTLFAYDVAVGNSEAGFYVGDAQHANTVVTHDVAVGNTLGIFVRHARHVKISQNVVTRNCQGILVLDDGQRGGAGNTTIWKNAVIRNNKFCPPHGDNPLTLAGGGILLLGATRTQVLHNAVVGNQGHEINSGGIVVVSAHAVTKGSDPRHDLIAGNVGSDNRPAALVWDGSGVDVRFVGNHCGKSIPAGLCQ
jgi:Right handed beta helix region